MLKVNVTKQFESFTLDIDLEIKPAFSALFGPSGSGKTTTLNMIAGLTVPDEGEISIVEKILFSKKKRINVSPQKRCIGYIFQEGRLFPHLSAQKNLEFGYKKIPGQTRKFNFDEIVEVAGIGQFLNRMPEALSGGEKQRVALARAILASPDYLLMDEPLAALDLPTRLSFLQFLKTIHRQLDLPILYVSHDLSNVINFADDVIILKNGKNIGYGPPQSLLDKMSAPPLVSREDIANIFEVEVLSHKPATGLTIVGANGLNFVLPHLDCQEGELLLLNIPASEIILAIQHPQGLSASNVFPGKITQINHLDERVLVDIDAGQKFTVEIVEATVKRLALKKDKEVFLIFKASSFRRLA